jgi:hypothetical protein
MCFVVQVNEDGKMRSAKKLAVRKHAWTAATYLDILCVGLCYTEKTEIAFSAAISSWQRTRVCCHSSKRRTRERDRHRGASPWHVCTELAVAVNAPWLCAGPPASLSLPRRVGLSSRAGVEGSSPRTTLSSLNLATSSASPNTGHCRCTAWKARVRSRIWWM